MKKFLLLSTFAAATMAAQAQKNTIVTLGFEDGDAVHTTEWALTPGLGKFGDWVNVQEGDDWVEQCEDAAHSGQYGLRVLNGDAVSDQQWQRGFKIGHLPLKDNTSYRVSFWMKTANKFKSSLSIGREYFDNELQTPVNKTSYNYNWDTTDDEWKRITYVTFHTNKAFLDGLAHNRYTAESNPEGIKLPDGTVIAQPGDDFPENSYFAIFNMYNPGEYYLDDITIEENVAVSGVTFCANAIKIDFGYPTNIADLAKENAGVLQLPASCVTVKQGDTEFTPEYVECHADGFLYAFLEDGTELNSEEEAIVAFTPTEDCPIQYTTDKRPSADVESPMQVLGFEDESAVVDESIDAVSVAWSAPEYMSSYPENNSFNIDPAEFKEVVLNFNKEVGIDYASAILSYSDNFGSYEKDITANMKVGEDGTSIVITMPSDLKEYEYTLTVSDVENAIGIPCDNPVILNYSLGIDYSAEEAATMYASTFASDETDAVPLGWNTYNEAGYHLYGFNADGSRMKYNYGQNPGGGGTRLFDGFSGDFTKALYWGSRGTNEGFASFGELISDYMNPDGTIDEASLPDGVKAEDISLYLEPGKYNVSFKMAAWKGEPVFRFTLEDLDGNVYAQFNDYVAKPNLNGAKGKVTGTLALEADFIVENPGYYVLKFAAQDAQWQEFMLADVKVITMPSKAAYYNGLVAAAREEAQVLVEDAYSYDGLYDGQTLKALDAEVERLSDAIFHNPTEVNEAIDNLHALMDALNARIANINTYTESIDAVKEGLELIREEDPKYLTVDVVAQSADIVAQYGETDPSTLSDEVLADVAPTLAAAASKLANVKSCTDLLTWGINKGIQTYDMLGTDDEYTLNEAIEAVSDDREVAAHINKSNKVQLYRKIVDGTWKDYTTQVRTLKMVNVDDLQTTAVEDGDSIVGIELTGHIANPKMYRVNGNGTNELPGWTIAQNGDHAINIGWGGDAPSEAKYVTDQYLNYYGDGDYDLSQDLNDLPVGVYAVVMATRTPLVDKTAEYERIFYYNAQDSLGTWDKYMYVTVGDETQVTPYLGGSFGYGSDANNTVITNITVGEGATLTMGLKEHYVSGKAMKHEDNTEQGAWTGTVMCDDAHLYFIAPLEGYDYAAALKELETAIQGVEKTTARVSEIFNVNGVRMSKVQKGVNILRMTDGSVRKVLVK